MTKLTADHLALDAYVYVRQSTADQLRNNHESRRRQYGLADRARALGFSEVVVIDDDLGVSASGVARPGFDRLLAAICSGLVGAVVSIEASRLARNGRDWHTLLEFCALVGSVLIDEDGIYGMRSANPPCVGNGDCVIRRRLVQRWRPPQWLQLGQPALRLCRQAASCAAAATPGRGSSAWADAQRHP